MNNEIGRKITSLTLMTIMVAGGMTFAVPGIMPAAHAANANLFVSAENSQFNNYFGGGQVIEVVINDPDIKDTDEAKGEPDVTINGKILRMVQATDGLWYAYFTDKDTAAAADNNQSENGEQGHGLDYGGFCENDSTVLSEGAGAIEIASDTQGITIPRLDQAEAAQGLDDGVEGDIDTDNLPTCASHANLNANDDIINNVVREAKTPVNSDDGVAPGANELPTGQIGIDDRFWPFIQLYDLNPTGNVVVQYNKGGNPQTVTLTFDTLDGTLDASLDRDTYPR